MNICNLGNKKIKSCTGCGCCAVICPETCISMINNEEGFLEPIVDESRCIDCGACCDVCYQLSDDFSQNEIFADREVLAAITNDINALLNSSSGGIAQEIEKSAILLGYKICGVCYDVDSNLCFHKVATTNEELNEFRISKYLQSHTVPAFQEFVVGEKYCVFGTPCQIFGLDKILQNQKRRDDFILVDLFCKGVPSFWLWNNYLTYLRESYHMSDFVSINFRSKKDSWHKFCMEIIDKNGRLYSNSVYDDLFYQFYIKNVCMNTPCYDCDFRHHYSSADIRLGDFWGSDYYSNKDGVSLVVLFTDTGKNVWNMISTNCWSEKRDPAIVTQSQRFDRYKIFPYREQVIEALKEGIQLDEVYAKFKIKSINYKIRNEQN